MKKLALALLVALLVVSTTMVASAGGRPDKNGSSIYYFRYIDGVYPSPTFFGQVDCYIDESQSMTPADPAANIYLIDHESRYFSVERPFPTWGGVKWVGHLNAGSGTEIQWVSNVNDGESLWNMLRVRTCDGKLVYQKFYGSGLNVDHFDLKAGQYNFWLGSSVVPEPGNMTAMLGGLVGLGGFALRRRRA